jgi:hypothetical protein
VATPDPRLFELITLLAEVGADWLGFEILDGVRHGFAVEESREALLNAQMAARFGRRPQIEKERTAAFSVPQELHGDEQLAWAANYVVERLTDEAEMLDASFEQLNILALGREPRADQREQGKRGTEITLQIGEEGPVVQTVEIVALRRHLAALTRALERWLGTTRERR